MGLLFGKGLQMGSGFLFWVVAARAASVTDLGIAAATASGVMFCTQLGLLGTGSAVIVQIGRGRNPQSVLDTAFTLVAVASLVTAGVLLFASPGLRGAVTGATSVTAFAVLVLAATTFGTAIVCLDQAAIALGHAGSSMLRYSVGGTASVLAVLGCLLLRHGAGAEIGTLAVFACWTLSTFTAVALGALQLRRWVGYRYQPVLHMSDSRRMLGVGLPNQLLTLTERGPQLLLPVFLAHLVSPEATAYWYPAWMMAWIVYTAPVSIGLVQFARGVRHPSDVHRTTWSGLRWSLALGGVLALLLGAAADPLLRLMGSEYAAASANAVRILAVGLVPYAVLQAYNALCRASDRLLEGTIAGALLGVVACGSSLLVAERGPGLMAVAWVASLTCGAVWALVRLRQLSTRSQALPVTTGTDVDSG